MKKLLTVLCATILSASSLAYANMYTTDCNEFGCISRGGEDGSKVCTSSCNGFGCITNCN